MRLIVTRPEPDNAALAAKLTALGHMCLRAPLLRIAPVDSVVIPDRDWQAVVISSANGARAIAAHQGLDGLVARPAFAVGEQSATAARAAGFRHARAEGGSAAALAAFLVGDLDPARGPVLYLSGEDTAGDLAGRLRAADFAVERVVVYRAVAADHLPVPVAEALRSGTADGVLLYSPRAARIWRALTGRPTLMHFCLSANVAAALAPNTTVTVAEQPAETALLALLER